MSDTPTPPRPNVLPCPFCGKAPEIHQLARLDAEFPAPWEIMCKNPECRLVVKSVHLDLSNASNLWNKRMTHA